MTILVTGGAGFIGSNFVIDWLAGSEEPVINLDLLCIKPVLFNSRIPASTIGYPVSPLHQEL